LAYIIWSHLKDSTACCAAGAGSALPVKPRYSAPLSYMFLSNKPVEAEKIG